MTEGLESWCQDVEHEARKLSNGIFDFRNVTFAWADCFAQKLHANYAARLLVRMAIAEAKEIECQMENEEV